MPDAGTTDQQGQQPPPPPDQQIDQQISIGNVVDRLGDLFGADWEKAAGGGGKGGQFMFASIAELDAVIAQWEDELTAIGKDGDTINQAAGFVEPPAQDTMSVGQADATRQSLIKLHEHNQAMKVYAQEYIKKLKASRASMVHTDEGNQAQLRNADGS